MLWFLSVAAARKFCVDRYVDPATEVTEGNAEGKTAISARSSPG
jgi:hypothetical protein